MSKQWMILHQRSEVWTICLCHTELLERDQLTFNVGVGRHVAQLGMAQSQDISGYLLVRT
jgi:hypothetical protein